MYSMIHTPLLPDEIKAAFRLTHDIYLLALEKGALSMSYSDAEDPLRRLKMHNLSDAFFFAAVLALGWPIRPVDIIFEQADCISDDLYLAWEETSQSDFYLVEASHDSIKIQADLTIERSLECFQTALRFRSDLTTLRREVMMRHIKSIMELVSIVFLTHACANPLPDLRVL